MTSEILPQKRRRYPYWIAAIFLLLALALASLVLFWEHLPYQSQAARQIKNGLAARGIVTQTLNVESFDNQRAILSNIRIGGLHIDRLLAEYNWQEARRGKLKLLTLEGVEVLLYQKDDAWRISGLEQYMQTATGDSSSNTVFNFSELHRLLPEKMLLKNVRLKVEGRDFNLQSSLEGTLTSSDEIVLELASPAISMQSHPYTIQAGKTSLQADLGKDGKWKGKLASDSIQAKGLKMDLPPLALQGDFTSSETQFSYSFRMRDKGAKRTATGSLRFPLNNPAKGFLTLQTLRFPWQDGVIQSKKPARIALNGRAPIALMLEFNELQLAPLMDKVSQGKVKATGKIRGVLPITYHLGGRITLQDGNAQGMEEGVITVSPDLLPGGDRKEMETLALALQNFNYTLLKIRLSSDKDQKTSIHLTLEGRNPEALEGRQVKLNINFTGDILPLIQQSLLPFNDLEQLLRSQEKP